MHHWFFPVHTQIFSDIGTVQKKICLDKIGTKCLNKNRTG